MAMETMSMMKAIMRKGETEKWRNGDLMIEWSLEGEEFWGREALEIASSLRSSQWREESADLDEPKGSSPEEDEIASSLRSSQWREESAR